MTSVMSSFSMMMHQSFKADMCLKMNLCFSIHYFLASYPSSTSTSRLRNRRTVIWGFCCPKDWEENKHTLTLRHECWRLTRIDLNTTESLDGRNARRVEIEWEYSQFDFRTVPTCLKSHSIYSAHTNHTCSLYTAPSKYDHNHGINVVFIRLSMLTKTTTIYNINKVEIKLNLNIRWLTWKSQMKITSYNYLKFKHKNTKKKY